MTTATAYVRKATAAGAMIADSRSLFVTASIEAMDRLHQIPEGLQWCEHLAEQLTTTVALWPTFGDQADQLLCPDCWADPGRGAGCQACDRRPAPGLRRVLSSPTASSRQIVIVGQLCTYDRRRLA